MQSDLVARLTEDLDGLAATLRHAGVPADDAARLLGLASAAVVDAVTLWELRHAPDGLGEARHVHALERKIEPEPAQPVRLRFAQQAHRALARLTLPPDPEALAG